MLVGFSLTNDPFWVPHSWNKSYNHRKSINKSSLRLQLKHKKTNRKTSPPPSIFFRSKVPYEKNPRRKPSKNSQTFPRRFPGCLVPWKALNHGHHRIEGQVLGPGHVFHELALDLVIICPWRIRKCMPYIGGLPFTNKTPQFSDGASHSHGSMTIRLSGWLMMVDG